MWYYFNVENEAGDLGYIYNPRSNHWEELGKRDPLQNPEDYGDSFLFEYPITTVPYLG